MRLRTKLILAFLGLAVVPLGGSTIHSYYSSQKALRKAAELESMTLAEDLGERLDAASKDLNRRIARITTMPLRSLIIQSGQAQGDSAQHPLTAPVMAALGEAAPFIEKLEIMPTAPQAPKVQKSPGGQAGLQSPPPPPPPPAAVKPFVFRFEGQSVVVDGAKLEELQKMAQEMERWAGERARAAAEAQSRAARNQLLAQAAPSGAKADVGPKDPGRDRRNGFQRSEFAWRPEGPVPRFDAEMRQNGEVVGTVHAEVRPRQLLRSVLMKSERSEGEIPFAIDAEGKIQTARPEDLPKLEKLPVKTTGTGPVDGSTSDWIVATRKDPSSGLTFGIARPIADRLGEIRRTALRNLALGLGIVGLALIGILPLSSRMTRNLTALTRGAEQLARGNLSTRVPVRSKDEFGVLAAAFNRMAEDIGRHEKNVIEQERLRKELELCRRIQEDLLPHGALRSGIVEARGVSIPAREVGGDFFNYFPLPTGDVALLIGDVSGKGLPAALLMANLQATLQARLPLETDLARLAAQLDHQIGSSTPPEVYLTLFMAILDTETRVLRYVNAGHNTQFTLQPGGKVTLLESTGRPLGILPGGPYEEKSVGLRDGDCLFFYTDGLSEAENEEGVEFGTAQIENLLRQTHDGGIDGIIARVEAALRDYRGGQEPADDATMLLVKVG